MKIFLMILSIILFMNVAVARYPETHPNSININKLIGPIDRNVSSPSYTIFKDYVAGYTTSHTSYNGISFLCQSSNNPTHGACATSFANYNPGITTINLEFTERKSLIKKVLQVKGYKTLIFPFSSCPIEKLTLNSHIYTCEKQHANGTKLSMDIPAGELNKLPFGGIWEATLKLTVQRLYSQVYGTYKIDFRIDLTDKGNIQVWLPAFKTTPQIDLNLRPQNKGRYIGNNQIDMCFYDGYSTNSNSMEIIFRDDSGSTGGNMYYLNKRGAPSKKLPYSVSLLLGGRSYNPENGIPLTINNADSLEVNWNRITAVAMPEISVPVLCWPGQLLLNADIYNPQAGQYSGHINITFTPSSSNI
ncbi:fimbrial protein [Escherichia coli]|nr:fimbrial protein [Escherichia coli]